MQLGLRWDRALGGIVYDEYTMYESFKKMKNIIFKRNRDVFDQDASSFLCSLCVYPCLHITDPFSYTVSFLDLIEMMQLQKCRTQPPGGHMQGGLAFQIVQKPTVALHSRFSSSS